MERSPLKGVENTRHELQDKNYKKLYHELVERHGILQSQLESYNSLFKKFGKIKHLKDRVLACLSEKLEKLNQQRHELTIEKERWEIALSEAKQKQRQLEKSCAALRATQDSSCTEHTRRCGRLLAQFALGKAQARVQQDVIHSFKRKLTMKCLDVQNLKKTVSNCEHSLKRNRQEFQESLDFSEAERMTLVEDNAELNDKVSTLTAQLREANQLLDETRIQLEEQKKEVSTKQDATIVSKASGGGCDQTCSGCDQLRRELDAALLKLNEQSCAKYGDLLRENFALTQKLKSAEETVSRGLIESQRLATYIQDYKTKSKLKVEILKENVGKAEEEVSELDHIIEQVREVMHQEIGVVKHSPALLLLIRELDGVEAPSSY